MAKGATIRMWRRSLVVLGLLVFLSFAVLIYRLITLQIFQGESLLKMAFEQQLADTKISAQRGTIFDRNMKPLAQSATVWNVVLEPSYIKSEEKKELICQGLHEILDIDKDKLTELAHKKSCYTIVKKKVESDVKDKIIEFKNTNKISTGIRLIEDYKRYYPHGNFLSAVLGCVGDDSQGLAGLEAYYGKTLKGESGRIVTAKNALGSEMPFNYEQMIPAQPGQSLKLCIDESIQHFLEKNLEEGIKNNKVQNRAAAIAMDVNTGEILGMAVKEGFDPNEPFKLADEEEQKRIDELPEGEKTKAKSEAIQKQWRNKAVSDTYYPGSVFKMVTAAMGFELGVLTEQTPFHCSGSIVPVPGAQRIHCWKRAGHGSQTFLEAFLHSCNPAFISLGMKIGTENFFNLYKSFGLHEKTNIDLPGEASNIFFSADGKMAPIDLAVASMGQNFSITPLQMISAASAIANGGKLVQPHVVKEILDHEGNIVKSIEPEAKRMIISKETSKRVTEMLRENAVSGAARNAYVPGYRVAGKTGTSEKIGLSAPGQKDYISSFCGFAPADDPKIAVLVFFDTPKSGVYYGAQVAAPVFAKAMQEILPYLGIEKVYTEDEMKQLDSSAPALVGKDVKDAKTQVQAASLNPIIIGNGETVIAQIPEPSGQVPKGGNMILYTDSNNTVGTTKVPKLTGLTIYEATKTATSARLNIKIARANSAESELSSSMQSIAEGTEVPLGTAVTVTFINKTITD